MHITAPTDGYVFLSVTATVTVHGDSTACTLGWGTSQGLTDIHQTLVGILDGSGTQRRSLSATSSVLYGKIGPGNYTFYATVSKNTFWDTYQVDLVDISCSTTFFDA
jgi:hypothetical protein